MKKSLFTLISITALLISANAQASVVIDFEGNAPGEVITNTIISGATFSVIDQGTTGGDPRDLMIFNSNCSGNGCSGGDSDLSTVDTIDANNILIISTDNDSDDPNDSASGGIIIAKFDDFDISSVKATTIDVGDSDVGPNKFEVYLDGMLIDTFVFALGQGDNNVQMSDTFNGVFDEVRLVLKGSGALASLEFTPVPIPAALPLFMAGLLGLAGLGKKSS